MAQTSKFINFLEKVGLVQRVDSGEEQPRPSAPRQHSRSTGSSVYERNYRAERGQSPSPRPVQHRGTGSMVKSAAVPAVKPDTVVYYLGSLSECADVIRAILDGTSVVINFSETDDRLSQRIIDTLSGAAFALNAKVRKITDDTYLIAPSNVNINTTGRVNRRY